LFEDSLNAAPPPLSLSLSKAPLYGQRGRTTTLTQLRL